MLVWDPSVLTIIRSLLLYVDPHLMIINKQQQKCIQEEYEHCSSWDKPAWPWSVVLWNITGCPLSSRESGWNKCITECVFDKFCSQPWTHWAFGTGTMFITTCLVFGTNTATCSKYYVAVKLPKLGNPDTEDSSVIWRGAYPNKLACKLGGHVSNISS